MSILLRNSATATETVAGNDRKAAVKSAGVQSFAAPGGATPSEEKCPVIRANQVILSAASSGRLRVLFF